ncbi:MAG: secretin N-terminal domain-containing protein [Limisphaerales bacterium]
MIRPFLLGAVLSTATHLVAQDAAKTNAPAASPEVVVRGNAPAASQPGAARNIRFQFDGIPYTDVIERFAQMAGKPLLSDTNVVGTLTYDDPNAYTYTEALDTLNLMLAMKGVMLLEDGNNLRVVPFKNLQAMPLRILRGTEPATDVRPNEVVTVVLDSKNLDSKEITESILPMLSQAGSVAPLGRGRGLIVTDRLTNIQRVKSLLATIGSEQAAERQMRSYTLVNASGAIVSDLLNRTFGVATAPKRTSYNPNTKVMEVLPADPNDYITSVYDEASRTLVLFGPTERLELAEELINKFEQKDGASGDVRIYSPQTIKAEELANMIRQAIPGVAAPGETGSAAATKARVIADNAQNRLIVAAPLPGQLDQIEQLVTRVDKGLVGAEGLPRDNTPVPNKAEAVQLTRIFRPRATEATNVTTILRQALTRKEKSGKVVTTASVTFDPGSQSVVVTGTPNDLQTAADIVAQLETGTSQPTQLVTRFIEVGSPEEARRIQPLVEQLYKNQTADGSTSSVAHAKILSDTQTGRLIVTASADHLRRIEDLVTQLQADKPQVKARDLRVIPLKNSRTETALPQIQSLVNERMADRRFSSLPKPSIVADAANNRLLVTATADQLKEIDAVIDIVDTKPAQTERELAVIPLQAKPAAEVLPLVNQLLGQLSTQGSPTPTVMADPTGKQLIVLATSKDQDRIRTLVKQFDVSPATAAPRQFKGIELYGRTATEFTPLVQQLYQEQLRGQPEPAGGAATLLSETKNNRIMVSGSEREISRVETIIRQLDPAERKSDRDETRVIRLRSASAADLAGLVDKSLNAQSQQVKVLTDTRSNSLVVTGSTAAVEAAAKMIQQLDSRPEAGPREMRVIELKSADARALETTVATLFGDLMKDQRGANYVSTAKITADPVSNRLIATGDAADLEIIAGIVNRLDNSPQQAPGARVFKLNQADAVVMAPIVASAMTRFDQRGQPVKRVSITADEKSNSLIVSGSRTDLQDVESVIEKLDGGESSQAPRTLKILEVKGDPDALATLINKSFAAQNPGRNIAGLFTLTPDPSNKRLIVFAPPTMLAQVESLVTTLDARPDQGARELHPVSLKNATPSELLPRVQQIYTEQSQGKTLKPATLYPDAAGNRILVQGTTEQADDIRQITTTLESEPRPTRESKIFDLGKLAEAQRLMPLIQQLYRDQLSSAPQLGTADAQIVSDGKTGRLLVSARADQLPILEGIVQRLQATATTGTSARESRTVEVGNSAEASRLVPLIQQLYQDRWKDRLDTDPADAQILADPRNGRLILTGKPEHLTQIEAIIQQLGPIKTGAGTRQTRIIDLTTASAVELASTVRTLYLEEAKGRLGSQAPDTVLTPDPGGNRLIVVGDTNELAAVERLVAQLDKVSSQSASARVFKIKSADPEKVAEILNTSLVRYDAYGRAQKRATVSVDPKTRTLIVTGDPKELQGVSVIIEQLDQSLGSQPERRTKVVTLKQGKAATLSPKIRQLYADRIKSLPELGTSDILILEEPESNQLIIAGNEAQLQVVTQIVDEVQSAQVQRTARETQMIPVGTVDELNRLQPLVQQLYNDRFRGRDASDPADATIIADGKNARFIITGRTNQLREIESIIGKLRGGAPESVARDTRIIDLASANAVELAPTLRTLYQEQVKNRPGSFAADTLITPDVNGNRLILTGATNELALLEDLIQKLDKVGAQSASTRVFKVKSADPDKVVEILGSALVRYDAYGRPQKRVSVVTDPKTRTIIATGDPKELQSASVIIEQLDSSLGSSAGRTVRVVPVKERRAGELLPKVRQLYQDQARNNPDFGTSEPLLIEDAASNQLIVAGNEKQLSALEEIVGILQQVSAGQGGRQVKVFNLERTTANTLVTMIGQVYARQLTNAEPTERVVVGTGGNERTLVVEAPATTLTRIEELVKNLDQPGPEGQNVIQTVKLKHGRAEDLAEAVNRVMTNRALPGMIRRVSVTSVSGANSLLLNGPTNAVQEVLRIVEDLDQDGPGSGDIEVRIYKLENGNAREVSNVIQQLLQSVSRNLYRRTGRNEGEGGRRNASVSISIDERSNSLIISATEAHFRMVDKILPTLDKAPERSDRDVQFVWLKKAKAFDIAMKLDNLFEDRPRADRPVIEPDSASNSLTIIAKRGDIPQIQDLVSRLDDQGRDSAVLVRVRPLERVTADQMATMLQNIYPQMSGTPLRVTDKVEPPRNADPGTETTSAEVVIAVDKPANALILSGPAQELDAVERLIGELSLNFYGNEAEFRVFAIKDADPVVVARTLQELLKMDPVQIEDSRGQPKIVTPQNKITVVAEPRTRSLIVRARPTDFALMESLIKQLDTAGQVAQLEFKVVALAHAAPEKILPLVQQMVTQLTASRPGDPVTVAVDSRGRGMLVIARGTTASQVEKLILSLDKPTANVEAEVEIVSLKKANAGQLAAVLQGMLRPGAAGESTPESRELQEHIRRLKVRNANGDTVLLDLSKPIRIATDPVAGTGGGNRIILTSTTDNLRALKAVVEQMDSVAVLEGVKVRFIQLENADATAVSQTLNNVFSQAKNLAIGPGGPGGQPAAQGKALVQPLNVAIDARSNTLILSGHPESLDLAQKIVADMDKEVFLYTTDVRLFRLKHASAARLLPLLQSVFTEGASVPGTEGLSTQITRLRTLRDGAKAQANQTPKNRPALTIQADDQANILVVAARSDNLPLIADIIEQLDIPAASGLETVRVYPLEHADPAAVQKVLSDLFTGPRATTLRNEDRPVITVDARTGSLVVAGNSKAFAIIEGLLKSLDQKLPFDLRDIALIPLEHADANVVAPTLQKLMDARVTQRATLNQGQADALKVIIMADQRSNALLVGGAREGFELVQTLARQLDQAAPALSGRVRLVPLEFADARVVASTLGTLFEQRYAAIRTADMQRNKPIILADTRSNSLLVAASQEDNRTLDDLLKRLDAKQDNPSLTLTVIPMRFNDSARVATMLESLFAARQKAQLLPGGTPLPSDQIKVETDALNNALIISASKENLELVRELVAKVDQEPTIAGGVFEMFTLEFADANRVSTILKSLVDQGLYRPGRPANAPARGGGASRDILSVSVDPRSNTLIVSASPENLSIVRDVVKRLDTKDLAANADVRLYPLKNARASTLATTLQQFFQAKRTADSVAVNANERTIATTVLADDRINSLIVTGGKEAFDLMDRMLPQMDGESVFSRLNFRVFPLKKATALKLQATLQPIFANRPPKVRGEPVDPITVIADQWVNALLVGATVEDLSTVASLIEKLDSDPAETGIAIHVFPLQKADATKVVTTVRGLFRDNLPNQVVPITVTADERINAIVVSCGETDAQRIGELVQKLDTDQVAKVSEIKVFPLQFARAESLATILNTALNTKPAPLNDQAPNAQSVLQFITRTAEGQELVTAALKESVLITPDQRMNSLVVSGPVDYMGLIEQIIQRMDASSPQLAKIKVFSLQNADARQMGDVITQMFRMTPTTGTGSTRSVQYTLVRGKAENGASTEEPLASATLGTAEQTALTVTVDPRTNSLLVGGTEHYMNLVSQLIDTLDSSAAHERASEVIRLKNSQAPEIATAIRNFLDQERQKLIQSLGVDAVSATARLFDQEVAIVSEPTSNTILLSANNRYFKDIRMMIDELDSAQPQVLIQVLLAEVRLDNQTDLGFEWTYRGTAGSSTYGIGTDFDSSMDMAKMSGLVGGMQGGDFSFLLRALKTQGKLHVLSRPQIVTADNKPATINVGKKVPLVEQTRLDAQNNLTTQYRYEDVGVNLTVTPKISRDGFVKMEISTTNSTLSAQIIDINKSASAPVVDQRKANTTVSAQSGQTIVIGGLIDTYNETNMRKVPVLGDIPYLGVLFRTTSTRKERKELLILMTPIVLENSQVPVKLTDPDKLLRDNLDNTDIKQIMREGDMQRRMLEPFYKTNRPSWRDNQILTNTGPAL